MIGIVPTRVSTKCTLVEGYMRTHRHRDAIESADYSIDIRIDIIVACLSTVHSPVRLSTHPKAEKIRLTDDEV